VSQEQNSRIAQELLAGIGAGAEPDKIAELFSGDAQFDIQGDVGALPWIGRQSGRSAASDFFRDLRRLVEPIRFDVQDILTSDARAVIVGELASRVRANGRIVESAFALILTVSGGEIIRFQMLEDSFAVSRATRS
jgi:uncharacterized protein